MPCRPRWPTSPPGKPNCGGIFDFDNKSEKLEQVNQELEDPTVWNDQKRALALGQEKKALEGVVHSLTEIDAGLRDARDLFEMAREYLNYLEEAWRSALRLQGLLAGDGLDPPDGDAQAVEASTRTAGSE